jgi:hypothetical protein
MRKLFSTTNKDDSDIAAAAYIGDKLPLAAIGINATL